LLVQEPWFNVCLTEGLMELTIRLKNIQAQKES